MIVGALLARNEADRYLERAIRDAQRFCDKIVVLDDGSTDDTPKTCETLGCEVTVRDSEGFWGDNEVPARQELWELATVNMSDWAYFFDADHVLEGNPEDIRTMCKTSNVNAWAIPLWDCWNSDTQHRVDGYWQAWHSPRPWLVRALDFKAEWGNREIHTGHLPANYPLYVGLAPIGMAIRHLGYINPKDREAKAAKYLALA